MRVWLVAALMTLVSALILGANLALLGYAQPRNDPVGQLTPARLMESERDLPSKPGTTPTNVSTITVTTPTTVTVPATVTTPMTVTAPTTVTRPQPPPPGKTHTRSESDD